MRKKNKILAPRPTPRETRDRLLDAAEAMIARFGVNGASIRDITAAAKVNVASISYHFGSKEGLIAALMERRVAPVNAERLRRFDAIEATEKVSIRPLLEAFIVPVIESANAAPQLRDTFLIVMVRLKSGGDRKTRDLYRRHFAEVWERFLTLLRKALPGVSTKEREELAMMTVSLITGAILHSDAQGDTTDAPLSAHRLIDYAEGAFACASTKRKRR